MLPRINKLFSIIDRSYTYPDSDRPPRISPIPISFHSRELRLTADRMAKKPRLLRVKRSPRYEGEGRGRNEGEGETRLIKRRPPPSANGPTAQELHAGNCCANTTTFILQPLGKRHILFKNAAAPLSLPLSSFSVRNLDLDSCLLVFGTRWSRSFRRSK